MPKVASCILEHSGKILLLKRSDQVRTYRGLWGSVAGYVEDDEEPLETALKEIEEEVGLHQDEIYLVKRAEPVTFIDVYRKETYHWTVYPFLFHIEYPEHVTLDWEHTEYRWIVPSAIRKYKTAPRLKEIVADLII